MTRRSNRKGKSDKPQWPVEDSQTVSRQLHTEQYGMAATGNIYADKGKHRAPRATPCRTAAARLGKPKKYKNRK